MIKMQKLFMSIINEQLAQYVTVYADTKAVFKLTAEKNTAAA